MSRDSAPGCRGAPWTGSAGGSERWFAPESRIAWEALPGFAASAAIAASPFPAPLLAAGPRKLLPESSETAHRAHRPSWRAAGYARRKFHRLRHPAPGWRAQTWQPRRAQRRRLRASMRLLRGSGSIAGRKTASPGRSSGWSRFGVIYFRSKAKLRAPILALVLECRGSSLIQPGSLIQPRWIALANGTDLAAHRVDSIAAQILGHFVARQQMLHPLVLGLGLIAERPSLEQRGFEAGGPEQMHDLARRILAIVARLRFLAFHARPDVCGKESGMVAGHNMHGIFRQMLHQLTA